MFGLGAGEIFLIGVIALIFIGPKKLPELARGLGKGIREFQKAKDSFQDELESEVKENVRRTKVAVSEQVESERTAETAAKTLPEAELAEPKKETETKV